MSRLYARRAQQHWARWRPEQLRQIPDPERFFTELGAQVETQVDQLTTDLAGPDLAGESYLAKVGRLRMARFSAEAQVLRDLLLLPDEQDEDQDQDWTAPADLPAAPSTSGPDLGSVHPRRSSRQRLRERYCRFCDVAPRRKPGPEAEGPSRRLR